MGTWMQSAAQQYLVYDLTGSTEWLGFIGLAAGLPSWFLMLYAGVVADRVSRRKMLIVIQSFMMLLAFFQAWLTLSGLLQPWHLIVLSFSLGVANAFDAPTRLSFVSDLVERKHLTNAIALNGAMFTSAVLIGPAVGGFIYNWFGPGVCFLINGLSFLAVLVALSMMRLQEAHRPVKEKKAFADLLEGIQYTIKDRLTRNMVFLQGTVGLLGFGMVSLLPAWAKDVLGGDAGTNGLLLSARGAGSLLAALVVAAVGVRVPRGRMWTVGSFILAGSIFLFGLVEWLPVSMLVLMFSGLGFLLMGNNANALVQSNVPDNLRSRAMSVYTMVFFGAVPLGSMFYGQFAAWAGLKAAVLFSSVTLMTMALIVWFSYPDLRRTY
jgi:MFS family permease